MKIAVLGAAGNVGSRVVDAALAAGHDVVASVRRPGVLAPRDGLEVVVCDATDAEALASALAGVDVLVVAITGKMSDGGFMDRTFGPVLEAAGRAGVGRLVLVSVFGAGPSAAVASAGARLVYRTVLRGFLDDKARADEALIASGLGWTIVHPVNLKDAPSVGGASVTALDDIVKVPGLPTLPFDDAARAVLDVALDHGRAGQRVVVSTPRGLVRRG